MAEKVTLLAAYRKSAGKDEYRPSGTAQMIADFLNGCDDGGELFRALYGDAAKEPLPPGLAALVKQWRVC